MEIDSTMSHTLQRLLFHCIVLLWRTGINKALCIIRCCVAVSNTSFWRNQSIHQCKMVYLWQVKGQTERFLPYLMPLWPSFEHLSMFHSSYVFTRVSQKENIYKNWIQPYKLFGLMQLFYPFHISLLIFKLFNSLLFSSLCVSLFCTVFLNSHVLYQCIACAVLVYTTL